MQLGLVVGTATSTLKHTTLRGQKLLIVQPLMADCREPDGDPQIARVRLVEILKPKHLLKNQKH